MSELKKISKKRTTYSKFQTVYARPGLVGETIETHVQSGKETAVVVKENQIVIRN